MKIVCNRCGSTLTQMGGSVDTEGTIHSYTVLPCHTCIGDAEKRGFGSGQKARCENLDVVTDGR
jgi:hypothetical protein